MWRVKREYAEWKSISTHGLGPIAQVLNINRGDKMDYLVAMSSNDFLMAKWQMNWLAKANFISHMTTRQFRGNMNTTTIRTNKGKTIMFQHDVSSPGAYSRIH